MHLLQEYIVRELPELHKNHVRLRAIGRLEALPAGAQKRLAEAIEATAHNKGLMLVLALNYGGRQEIVDACNRAPLKPDRPCKMDEKNARSLFVRARLSGARPPYSHFWRNAFIEFPSVGIRLHGDLCDQDAVAGLSQNASL